MEQFKRWWQSITPREQLLAMISAIVVVIGILYWGIWSPLNNQLIDNKQQLERVQNTLNWTQEKATILRKANTGKVPEKRGNLTQILNRSADNGNITFSRIVNKGERVEVWITEVEFNTFLRWVANLSHQHGIEVLNVDLGKTDRAGYIRVNRLLLGPK